MSSTCPRADIGGPSRLESDLSVSASDVSGSCAPLKRTERPFPAEAVQSTFSSIDELCSYYGGTKPIRRLLIANNGSAAMKAIKSLRAWCLRSFSSEREIEIVGMATPDDELGNAEYISRCDYLVKVPGGASNFNYANVNLLREIAEEWDCDALWPGWGHASEDYRVPQMLESTCKPVRWIGPPAAAMRALGCKIGSSIIAQSVGVPVVPWSGSHISVERDVVSGRYEVNDETREGACVRSAEHLIEMIESEKLGFPLMIKAAAGGGGKGIRVVHRKGQVVDAFRQVANEVRGSLIFAMKMVTFCRHLEVQILADQYGNVISLGSRDCTIQRRHQKLVEEGPPICASLDTIDQMEQAAVRLCTAVGYVNAATVEFLFDLDTHKFYFLEVNARLQVEHVVTEMLIDVNLPVAQIAISMGIRIDKLPDVAAYMTKRQNGTLEKKHCITARVTAEDAESGFQPTCGEVHELSFESSPNVWAYFSISSNSRIHQYSDSQFGHIFATCPTRESARNVLILSLRSLIVRGEISTNVEALQKILESADFITNETYTTWLEQRVRFTSPPPARQLVGIGVLSALIFAAVYRAARFFAEEEEKFLSRIGQGQVPSAVCISYNTDFVYRETTKFHVECYMRGSHEIRVSMNGSHVDCEFNPLTVGNHEGSADESTRQTGWYFISGGLDGKHRRVCFREDRRQDTLRVTVNGTTYNFTKEKDPSQIRAPFSGKLVRWIVPSGSAVYKGTAYAEIEIMKLYVQLTCEASGVISHSLSEGAIFSSGDLLATLILPEGHSVVRPVLFEGLFPRPLSGKRQQHSCRNGQAEMISAFQSL